MKFPSRKQIGFIALCIIIPGAIYAGLAYLAIKKINANKKTTIKKSKDQKTDKSTARKHNRSMSGIRKRRH